MEYVDDDQSPVFRFSCYSLVSHYDWFLRKSIERTILLSEIEKNQKTQLLKLPRKPFNDQIVILSKLIGDLIDINIIDQAGFEELILVRNLGIHNSWFIDAHYLHTTKLEGFKLGEKRQIKVEELYHWQENLFSIITKIRTALESYCDVI